MPGASALYGHPIPREFDTTTYSTNSVIGKNISSDSLRAIIFLAPYGEQIVPLKHRVDLKRHRVPFQLSEILTQRLQEGLHEPIRCRRSVLKTC